jgi:hypothetical protein
MTLWYAYELLGAEPLPEGFDKSLTVDGAISHGAARYPVEWQAILASIGAVRRLLGTFNDGHPIDACHDKIALRAAKAIAGGGALTV